MIINNSMTLYHKEFENHQDVWVRYNYSKVWWFGGKGASINKGYQNADDVQIRIPYRDNDNLDISNFAIGDIVVKGTFDLDITTQQDLDGYEFYNITSISDNQFGNEKHIRIGGK